MTTIEAPQTTEELHIVIAAIGTTDGRLLGHIAVSAPKAWSDALAEFDRLEDARRRKLYLRGTARGHVLWYAVRGISDPRWSGLVGRGYDHAYDKYGKRSYKGLDGDIKATKAWAKLYGYHGAGGGWIYAPGGRTVCQGWGSLAIELKRGRKIAQGADGLWYVLDRELMD